MRRIRRGRISNLGFGLIFAVLLAIGVYFAFAKAIPFRHHYTIHAVFQNSNFLHPASPVRVAGVDVGEVTSSERYKHTKYALVTMRIDGSGRPVHTNATMKIRPRLFLEGNFYIDLKPGTASAPEVPDGGTIPLRQTSRAVQLDQLLDTLQKNTRESLKTLIAGYGNALGQKPTAADDASHPLTRGLTGGQALNKSLKWSTPALRDSAIVNGAMLGTRTHDLSRTVRGFARATQALATDEADLTPLVQHFNETMAAFARTAPQLQRLVELLGPFSEHAREGFASLARAMPATRRFARDLAPGVAETPATIEASNPWLDQVDPLLGKSELGGLLSKFAPATRNLAELGHETRRFLPRIDEFNRCANNVLIPGGNLKIKDGPFSAGTEAYKEFWYSVVGLAGSAQGFDGNGSFLRLAAAGGPNTIKLGRSNKATKSFGALFANPVLPSLRTRPAYPNAVPPLRRDVPCRTQPLPAVNGPASTGPADGGRANGGPPPKQYPPAGVKMAKGVGAGAAKAASASGGGN